ncbi:MAG: hypothetical protein LBD47_05305 [Treponema sp.]|jgi:hypothetical protein|nr:hypothetical protein [Treponema sp.]
MLFLDKTIADALCTVITLGFAREMERTGQPLVFEYEVPGDAEDHELIRDAFGPLGVMINVRMSAPQVQMPYILGANLPQNRLNTFINDLHQWADQINNMFNAANGQNPPRGAYIGVQFFVDANGNILRGRIANNFDADPLVYGPSALSQHCPVYREITFVEEQGIGLAYYNARKSTIDAARAVANGLNQAPPTDFDKDYRAGHIFGSGHGMIRAMVNSVMPPPGQGIDHVFAEIALGAGTTKVSSCVPCAIFMQSFGYPASSIHLGRGDNWRIPDRPSAEILHNWTDFIVNYYLSGLELFNPSVGLGGVNTTLDDAAKRIIESNAGADDIILKIPNLFLEALTFEDSFMNRIKRTLFP